MPKGKEFTAREAVQRRKLLIKLLAGGTVLATATSVVGAFLEGETGVKSEIKKYYPELAELPLRQHGTIETALGRVSWFNLDEQAIINPADLAQAYSVMQVVGDPRRNPVLNYPVGDWGINIPIVLSHRETKDRKFFFVPHQSTPPAWAESIDGATNYQHDPNSILSVVSIPHSSADIPPNTLSSDPNYIVNSKTLVEICQQVIFASPRNGRLSQLGAQEVTCNSLGRVLDAIAFGYSYKEYEALTNNKFISGKSYKLPLMLFDEKSYNSLGKINLPVKVIGQ